MTDDQTPAATPGEKMAAELSALAVQARTDARAHGLAATEHKPVVEQAAAAMGEAHAEAVDLEAQITELAGRLELARGRAAQADVKHAESLAVLAKHEKDGRDAADMAEKIDRLAADLRQPPDLPAPDRVLAGTGLMAEAPEMGVPRDENGRVVPPPGPIEFDPDDLPFNVVQAPDDVVAALTGGHRIVRHPAAPGLDTVVAATHGPGVTMPDTGLAPPPLDPPPGNGVHRHAKAPKRLDISGAFKTITGRLERGDEQDGEDRG